MLLLFSISSNYTIHSRAQLELSACFPVSRWFHCKVIGSCSSLFLTSVLCSTIYFLSLSLQKPHRYTVWLGNGSSVFHASVAMTGYSFLASFLGLDLDLTERWQRYYVKHNTLFQPTISLQPLFALTWAVCQGHWQISHGSIPFHFSGHPHLGSNIKSCRHQTRVTDYQLGWGRPGPQSLGMQFTCQLLRQLSFSREVTHWAHWASLRCHRVDSSTHGCWSVERKGSGIDRLCKVQRNYWTNLRWLNFILSPCCKCRSKSSVSILHLVVGVLWFIVPQN